MEFHQIKRDELKNWIGKPVWYQNLENINDFGWAFIHPETVKLQDGGTQLGYCKLIMTDPKAKDFYSWKAVRLYSKPAFRGLCVHCAHWQRDQLIRCALMEQGKDTGCTIEKKYRSFEPTAYYQGRGYTVKTFLRQLELSGYVIKKKEAANAA